jgi:hypothetical protein
MLIYLLIVCLICVKSQNTTLPLKPACYGRYSKCDKCNPPIAGIDFIKPRDADTYSCNGVYFYEEPYLEDAILDCSRYNINPYLCGTRCTAINSCGKNYVVGYGWVDANKQARDVGIVIGYIVASLVILLILSCVCCYIQDENSCCRRSCSRKQSPEQLPKPVSV